MGPLAVGIVGGLVVAAGVGGYTVVQNQVKYKNDMDAIKDVLIAASQNRPDQCRLYQNAWTDNMIVYCKQSFGTWELRTSSTTAYIRLMFSTYWGYYTEVAQSMGGVDLIYTEVDTKEFKALLFKGFGLMASQGSVEELNNEITEEDAEMYA